MTVPVGIVLDDRISSGGRSACLILVLVGLLVYANSLAGPFLFEAKRLGVDREEHHALGLEAWI